MQALKKIGAVVGSAVMLGSTLAGAALAADLGNFYDGIAVVDGKADNTLLVVPTGGSSPSGLAQDVVSAIGVGAEIAQNAVTSTGGDGSVTLAVESMTIDGKELESQLNDDAAASLGDSTSVTFHPTEIGGTTLKTLGYRKLKNNAGSEVKNEEKIELNNMENWIISHQQGNLVESSESLKGYDKTALEIPSSTGWITYTSKFDKAIANTKLEGQKIALFGTDYTVLSADVGEIKVAGSGLEQTIAVGDDGVVFEGYTVNLKSVLIGSSSATDVDKALIEVEKDGVVDSKLVDEGTTEVINGLEIAVTTAASAVGQDTTMGSANILLGGDSLILEDNAELVTNEDWQVNLVPGDDGTDAGLLRIEFTYSKTIDGEDALGPGMSLAQLDVLGGILSLTYDGMPSAARQKLSFRMSELELDNTGAGNQDNVVVVKYPSAVFNVGGNEVDTLYIQASDNTTTVTTDAGTFYYKDSVTKNYTDITQGLSFEVGSKYYLLNSTEHADETLAKLSLTEPDRTYPLGAPSALDWELFVNSTEQKFGNGDTSNILLYNSAVVAEIDDSSKTEFKTDYISEYGVVAGAASTSTIELMLVGDQVLPKISIGSMATTKETADAVLGGDAVTIGGVSVSAEGTAGGLSMNDWPMPVAKVDKDLTAADKGKNLVVFGGPLVNTVTAEVAANYPDDVVITNDDPGAGKGKVIAVDDPFASGADNIAVIVAGSDRAGTTAASQALQVLDTLTGSMVTVQYNAAGSAPTVV
ncbi:S-layer protein [Candidatus Undinarchaeota archaeon]